MLQNKRQDVDHLPIAARLLDQMLLERSESLRQFGEGSSVAQRARFALDDGEIVPPVIDCLTGAVV